METRKFKLLSGVQCETSKLIGAHQEYFTAPQYTDNGSGLNKCLSEVIVSLGSLKGITEEQAKQLLSQDRKQILMQLRDFSMSRHKDFKFNYKYKNTDGVEVIDEIVMPFDLKNFPGKDYGFQAEEYEEIWKGEFKEFEFELIDAKLKVKWEPLRGEHESLALDVPRQKRSTHTLVKLRHPRYFHQKDKNKQGTWINLDLKKVSYDDLEDLKEEFGKKEGDQDTTMLFKNPETGRDEAVDVTLLPAFFFPSQAQ